MGIKKMLSHVPGAKRLACFFGFIPDESREYFFRLLGRNSVGAEIGVHEGDFSAQLLKRVKPGKLHLIDPWKYDDDETYVDALYGGLAKDGQAELDARYEFVLRRFRKEIDRSQVEIHRGGSEEIVDEFKDEYFDWVYIDGNHLYEYVRQDLELYSAKVKRGCYITGDDYGVEGWWEGGVEKAVDEFVAMGGFELISAKCGQFVIRKL